MTTSEQRALLSAHRQTLEGLDFYSSLKDIWKKRALLPYLNSVSRAWRELDLSGVLCVDGLPTLYLTMRQKRITPEEAAELQRLFWNQGLATVLVIVDPIDVCIYSGMARPNKPEDKSISLVETMGLAEYTLYINEFQMKLATGNYYQNHETYFKTDATVDAYLLNNLQALRDKLTAVERGGLPVEMVHTFLARILFICYLTDRRIIDLGDYEACQCQSGTKLGEMLVALGTVDEKRKALHSLFNKLKEDFNGSMFEKASVAECRQLSGRALDDLSDFLMGHDLGTGQLTLDFWAYDFRMIPVETISAVYEDFLKKEDEPNKRVKGAYYTPRFLAESVVDMALRNCENLDGKRFLDPACGSGIFLVTLFNRLASAWTVKHPGSAGDYVGKADALKAILRDQLWGVDNNATACRIACFSLYLAFLDCFDPPDIRQFVQRNGKLPTILKHRDSSADKSLSFTVVIEEDFLEPVEPLPKDFDYIVGNPPWSGRDKEKGLHFRFIEIIPNHLSTNGTACILLPSKTLLNEHSNRFQAEWLRSVSLDEVVLLADYSFLLFKEAKCPSMIARFRAIKPDLQNAVVEYVTPKVTRVAYRDGIIPVSPRDRKEIPLRQVLSAATDGIAPLVWKQYLWGTPRDIKFLEMLRQMPRLDQIAGAPESGKRWVKGQGIKPYYCEKSDTDPNYPQGLKNPWPKTTRFLRADAYFPNMFVCRADCNTLEAHLTDIGASLDLFYRLPSEKLFQPPLVLISQGVGAGALPKVAFSDFHVVFQHSLQSISAPPEDEDLLLFLTVYLRSKLAIYFLFHTAANWGTERDKVHFNELLRVPFPLPGTRYAHRDAEAIVRQVATRVRELKCKLQTSFSQKDFGVFEKAYQDERVGQTNALQAELEPLIYKYFDLIDQEEILVEDTVDVIIPSATPGSMKKAIPSTEPVNTTGVGRYKDGLTPYAQTLTTTLNDWAGRLQSEVVVSALGGVHKASGMVCMTITLTKRPMPFQQTLPSDETIRAVTQLAEAATSRVGRLDYLRGVILFEGERIHIFKPSDLIGWTRTAALNDAAEIYARIASARRHASQGEAH
jgi:hypothetical protein